MKRAVKPKRRVGRPSEYDPIITERICTLLAEGNSLRAICRLRAMPGLTTVMQWLEKYPEFTVQYAQAREAQAEHFAQELVEIADSAMGKSSAEVQAARLAVDTRKWVASKLLPKKYGDSTTLKGDKDAPLFAIVPASALDEKL